MTRLNAKQLRKTVPKAENYQSVKRNPIYLVLDSVIDTYNIGSLFRLADAIAAEKIYLCGDCEYPPSSRIHKAAVGTEAWVPWTKSDSAFKTIKELKHKGIQIIAIEQHPKSVPYILIPNRLAVPCALVVGHETEGISKEVLEIADIIVELPMYGINCSLNVWGSAAIISYKILESLIPKS